MNANEQQQRFTLPPAHVYLPTGSTARSNPMDMYDFSACRIYLLPAGTGSIDITIKGSPNENGVYLQELSENSRKTAITTGTSFMLENISRYLLLEAANQQGSWTIWVVPMKR